MSRELWAGPQSLDVDGSTVAWTFIGDVGIEEVASPHGDDDAAIVLRGDGVTVTPTVTTKLFPVDARAVVETSGWVRRVGASADGIGSLEILGYDSAGASEQVIETRVETSLVADTWDDLAPRRRRVPTGVRYVALRFTLTGGTPAIGQEYWFDDMILKIGESPMLLDRGTVNLVGPTAAQSLVTVTVDLNLNLDRPPHGYLYLVSSAGLENRALPVISQSAGVITAHVWGKITKVTSPSRTRLAFFIENPAGVDLSGSTYTFGWTLYEEGSDT